MTALISYSSKSSAIRGIARLGIADKAQAMTFVTESDGKFHVDPAAINEALAAAQRATGDVYVPDVPPALDGAAMTPAAVVTTSSALAQMTREEIDADLAATCGHSVCPACGVHLSNGLMDFDSLAEQHGEKKAFSLQQHAWSCMGCGAEWGVVIEAPKGAKARVSTGRTLGPRERSTVEKPSEIVFALADAMLDKARADVVNAAVAKGVTIGTARAAYQHWFKARGKEALAKHNAAQ